MVSSYKLVKDNNQKCGQGTRKILGNMEGRSTPTLEDIYFKTCTTNCQEGFCAPYFPFYLHAPILYVNHYEA